MEVIELFFSHEDPDAGCYEQQDVSDTKIPKTKKPFVNDLKRVGSSQWVIKGMHSVF